MREMRTMEDVNETEPPLAAAAMANTEYYFIN
jgi:hypothetical protein